MFLLIEERALFSGGASSPRISQFQTRQTREFRVVWKREVADRTGNFFADRTSSSTIVRGTIPPSTKFRVCQAARAKLKLNWRECGEQNSSLSQPRVRLVSATLQSIRRLFFPLTFAILSPLSPLLSSLFPIVFLSHHPYYSGGIEWIINSARKMFM